MLNQRRNETRYRQIFHKGGTIFRVRRLSESEVEKFHQEVDRIRQAPTHADWQRSEAHDNFAKVRWWK
jgi:uncharacterized membrane protein